MLFDGLMELIEIQSRKLSALEERMTDMEMDNKKTEEQIFALEKKLNYPKRTNPLLIYFAHYW